MMYNYQETNHFTNNNNNDNNDLFVETFFELVDKTVRMLAFSCLIIPTMSQNAALLSDDNQSIAFWLGATLNHNASNKQDESNGNFVPLSGLFTGLEFHLSFIMKLWLVWRKCAIFNKLSHSHLNRWNRSCAKTWPLCNPTAFKAERKPFKEKNTQIKNILQFETTFGLFCFWVALFCLEKNTCGPFVFCALSG